MLEKIFPFLLWFKEYKGRDFKADLISGLTVAIVLIPQSMAYAQLAGLPAYYGLYAAFLPPLVAALFGSSRQLATGPVAVVSLMTAAALEPMATAGSETFIAYALMLALLAGIIQFLLGVLRLGLVVNFLSHPVVNGFTSAAAIIIATSQLSKVFGVEVDKAENHFVTILRVLESSWNYTHWPTFAMAALAIAIMVGLKRVNPRIPNVLVAVTVTTVLSWAMGFEMNKRVDITQIASAEVQTMLRDFNQLLVEKKKLNDERAAINNRLGPLASASRNKAAVLELQHKLALLDMEMAAKKQRSKEIRAILRDLHFAAVERPEGTVDFILQRTLSEEAAANQRIWRLKLGSNPLDESKILLMGGGAVIGNVPKGLPSLHVPELDLKVIMQLFPFALVISLLGFMEAISIARAMAARTGQKLNASQELIGQGLANIVGSFGGSYPVSGSFSRSAVNLQSGAVTGLTNVVCSLLVVVTLLFLTDLLYHLPEAVLASVVMLAVISLIHVDTVFHAWKARKSDAVVLIITFLTTLLLAPGVEKGIFVGAALSISIFLYNRMRPKVVTLAMGKNGVLECAEKSHLRQCRHIAAIRFDGSLFFANVSYLDEQVREIRQNNPDLKHILLVADGINDIDSSGEITLELILARVRSAGLGFSMCNVKPEVWAVLERTGLLNRIGDHNIYRSNEEAIKTIAYIIHAQPGMKEGACRGCPLLTYMPMKKKDAEAYKNVRKIR